jgi:UDP-N-acetylmuramyl pentapeptide synthase
MLDVATTAQAIGARHIGPNTEFVRVTTDSRDVRRGDLFVGIRGERFDGQAFADQALLAGACAVMVEPGARYAPCAGQAGGILAKSLCFTADRCYRQ